MFVIWGSLHGVALIIHRLWQQLGYKMWTWLAWLITFNFINVTWVFFRATDMDSALKVLGGMVDIQGAMKITLGHAPTSSIAWGGTLIDFLSQFVPAGLFMNLLAYAAIVFAFCIVALKNTAQLTGFIKVSNSKDGSQSINKRLAVYLAYAVFLFVIASYTMFISSSTVFLYFNF
ncbi:MBOAT family O-acyltransferase [Hydrogenovibrio thermophilus]|uniref:Uncharacterized protein n=1 Tax=Hydrogenovibrio thermophilus TaxID=265883 RepID=A0A410H3A4_9GAMM|nr:hypothetical protein [Hydrogenovibrio thermophilus]QAB15386.1 hypothetical protein EPV75_06785 [Hydrogenovibrio thermophilus]